MGQSNSPSGSSVASGSQPRLTPREPTICHVGRGHADALFPTTSSGAASVGDILPVTQPSDKAGRTRSPRSYHQRAQSTTAAPHFAQQHSSLAFPCVHSKSVSSVSHYHDSPRTPRPRVYSLSTLAASGDSPKTEALSPVAVDGDETIGSFAPTSCPRQHIHSMLGSMARPNFLTVARRRLALGLRASSSFYKPSIFNHDDDDDSSLDDSSPPASPIPSICRTPSSESPPESDYFPTAPSSAGPSTPNHSHSSAPSIRSDNICLTPSTLAALEERSKFRVRTSCSACHRPGSNYPCCPRCGEMWCCRECRLASTGGKRHVCTSK